MSRVDRSVHKRGTTEPEQPSRPTVGPAARDSATAAPESASPIDLVGLRKRFGQTTVLHGIDLHLEPGEVVGLIGPNGAGKSTLLKTLSGLYTADGGQILLGGQPVHSLGDRPDVAFIHQDLGLIDSMSITENLRLSQTPRYRVWPFLDRRGETRLAREALAFVSLGLSPSTRVGELSPAQKTLVAIARAFARGASTLFVDEATSMLTKASARQVTDVLRSLAERGAIVVLITHKLSEVLTTADRVVVLLDGVIAADDRAASLDRETLIAKMRAGLTGSAVRTGTTRSEGARELLRFAGVTGRGCGPVDLTLRAGEVVGLTGTPGSGLHDLGLMATGALRPKGGRVHRAENVRCGLVPPYRETQGGFDDLQVSENISLSALGRWRNRVRLVDGRREAAGVTTVMQRLAVKPSNPSTTFGVLSGGNKQKAIFGRLILQQPDVYVLCEPTRGVDVGTRAEIYTLIKELRDGGQGILVLSSDAEDLLAVCDRVAAVGDGPVEEPEALTELSTDRLEEFL